MKRQVEEKLYRIIVRDCDGDKYLGEIANELDLDLANKISRNMNIFLYTLGQLGQLKNTAAAYVEEELS